MTDIAEESLLDRAWTNIARGFRDIATGAARSLGLSPAEPVPTRTALRKLMNECLDARGGEVAARMRAAKLGESYLQFDEEGRRLFLQVLADDFATDPERVNEAIQAWQEAEAEERPRREEQLRGALQPPRLKLITRFLALPAGVRFLVDLRATLLSLKSDESNLRALDRDLKGLFESWFDVGFLDVQRVTWDSPASLLEKIIAYEAVHAIESWGDLRNRLESDRRLYGLFHPRMPDEPLAFVEVALTEGMANSVQVLLDESQPPLGAELADTANFYSISNTQQGLAGIAFGEWLIKKVVESLTAELPKLETFATLSPVPGFRAWLEQQSPDRLARNTPEAERAKVLTLAEAAESYAAALLAVLDRRDWPDEEATAEILEAPLRRLCLKYLQERRGDGQVVDPVARFHLRNGARLERINWLADRSGKGMRNAAGIMVNYLYDPDVMDANVEAYRKDGKVALSSELRSMAKQLKAESKPPEPEKAAATGR